MTATVRPDAPQSPPPAPVPADPPGEGTLAWVGPFAVFMAWLALDGQLPLEQPVKEVVRDLVILGSILLFSRRVLAVHARRAPHWLASVGLGLAVCALWVAPDLLVPGWRDSALFQNDVTGRLKTSIPAGELTPLMLVLRTMRAALLVPVLEELFWRGWLPRWLQDTRFSRVPLGTYTTFAFWGTALLFAAEHGPFWEVGLLCGIIYNWWMKRTRSLGDLILVHATTNLALSLTTIATGRWEFWM
ncbi:CAAX prenyl protease-related protein [Roseisolibacter sp. H3M3-2]|uniref:CAAX prenyl protease-related protein n=1 Tax=Roseisolibacter sp. H3M3-2 TaxID=3031323 RepID=UPI0023DC33A7|nr:CAAX prenyl protease-related protein [Roseisolibacter sp. H3M3-2]MDF1505422.1 CAAX prenyl protease-related protein [Roseisolibacter sp. H3M3-2]